MEMKIFTLLTNRDDIEAAKKFLKSPADGSKANKQARQKAIALLKEYADYLEEQVNKNDKSLSAYSMCLEIRSIEKIINDRSYPMIGMSDYERLKAYGWKTLHKAKRFDYFAKEDRFGKVWIARVPITIDYPIVFERNGRTLSLKEKHHVPYQ